jgi:hypothetical protein
MLIVRIKILKLDNIWKIVNKKNYIILETMLLEFMKKNFKEKKLIYENLSIN